MTVQLCILLLLLLINTLLFFPRQSYGDKHPINLGYRPIMKYCKKLCNTCNEMDNNLNYDLGWSCNNSYKRTNNGIDITHYKDDGYSILCFVEMFSLITQTRIFNFKLVSM